MILLSLLLQLYACASQEESPYASLLNGQISYPFVQTRPLGVNDQPKKFIIRSIKGGAQYVVEIPDAGEDYDIEIPIAAIHKGSNEEEFRSSAVSTDREILASMPSITKESPVQSSFMDKAFGVANSEEYKGAPSYTLGIAKITKLFKSQKHEYALIEVNNLIAYYPQSPKLFKMKGSIYLKMRNYQLAKQAWNQALELKPNDRALRKGVALLDKKINELYDPVLSKQENTPAANSLPTLQNSQNTNQNPASLNSANINSVNINDVDNVNQLAPENNLNLPGNVEEDPLTNPNAAALPTY